MDLVRWLEPSDAFKISYLGPNRTAVDNNIAATGLTHAL